VSKITHINISFPVAVAVTEETQRFKLGLAEKGPFSGVLQLSPLGSDVAALLQAPSDAD